MNSLPNAPIRPGGRRIKWSFATRTVPDLPGHEALLDGSGSAPRGTPRAGDVVIAEVLELGQNRRLELRDGRRATLFPGDLVGVVHAFRNPGRTREAAVPGGTTACHLLSPGGLCGEPVGTVGRAGAATLLAPRVQLESGARPINLAQFSLRPRAREDTHPRTILVVGSGAGSGKSSAACALVHGLVSAGWRVTAGKPCGSASARDLGWLADAGASKVLDFTDGGFASTARCTPRELDGIVEALYTHLCDPRPDFVVLEIADGISQRESGLVLAKLAERGLIDHMLYAVHDTLGVRAGLARLRTLGADVLAISGRVTCSPLAMREAAEESDVPVLRPEELSDPVFLASRFGVPSGVNAHEREAEVVPALPGARSA